MTDKEKIKAEIERRQKRLTVGCVGQRYAYRTLLEFIDSLPEEPVSEDLDEAAKEWLRPQLDKSYAKYGETKMMELTHFDGYAMLEAIEFGAKWKEEQMMKNAVECEYFDGSLFCNDLREKYRDCDKVKMVIVKSK